MSLGASVERTEPAAAVVCDAGPLIHLDELDSTDLLSDFREVLVPDAVWNEVVRHRPHALEARGHLRQIAVTSEAPPVLRALSRSLVLGPGETEALQVALDRPGLVLLTDDAAARLAAEALRVRVHGSIGVLLRAVRRGRRTRDQAIGILEGLHDRSSLHVRQALIDEVISMLRSPR
jgi:predicted nucleic acid-binding protein